MERRHRILIKVYSLWFFRRILPILAIEVLAVVVALKVLADTVFVAKVFENATVAADRNYWAFFQYLLSAFFQTHIIVQFAILLGLGLGALIARDAFRAIAAYAKTIRARQEGLQ